MLLRVSVTNFHILLNWKRLGIRLTHLLFPELARILLCLHWLDLMTASTSLKIMYVPNYMFSQNTLYLRKSVLQEGV